MRIDSEEHGEFEAVFRDLYPRARKVAERVLGEVEAAEDAAAEALGRAFFHWNRIRDLPYRDAWILRVAANIAVDCVRKCLRPARDAMAGSVPMSAEDLVDLRLALAAALRSLPARQRQAIVLRHLAGLSPAEVAAVLGTSAGNVRLQVHRGLKVLRERLGSTYPEVLDLAEF